MPFHAHRTIDTALQSMVTLIAVFMVGFHIYTAFFGILPGVQQMIVHLGVAFLVVSAARLAAAWKEKTSYGIAVGLAMIAASMASFSYSSYAVEAAEGARAGLVTNVDFVFGWLTILLILEVTRRTSGWPLPIVALIFMAYALWGHYIPSDLLSHRGYSLYRIVGNLYLGSAAVFGVALQASANVIALFLIFGALLEASKSGEFIGEFSQALLGKIRGGPAKVAVVASALFGSISGSVAANVVGTGSFTIPLMKRTGFSPSFAGAVEATASCGGQIMPPVMGATAFVMADIIGVSYSYLCLVAVIPAMLYFGSVFAGVDAEAYKKNLGGLSVQEIPSLKATLLWGGHLLIPLILMIMLLIFLQISPGRAGFWGIVATVGLCSLKRETRLKFKPLLGTLVQCAKGISVVAAACATAGIIVGIVMLTGLGYRLTNVLIELSGGNLPVLLMLTMIASLILGMGLPTVATYLILVTLVAPALIKMGVNIFAAHFFIFYFGVLANITPPVAIGLYAATGIARAPLGRTAMHALKLAIPGIVAPYVMCLRPGLLLQEGGPHSTLLDIFLGVLGITMLVVSMTGVWRGHLAKWERLLLGVAGLVACFAVHPVMIYFPIAIGALELGIRPFIRRKTFREATS